MGRRIIGTNGADRITQGTDTEIQVFAKGGNDTIILNRSDDLGGFNFVDAGAGKDGIVNRFEGGNDIRLGLGNDTYVGTGFAFSSGPLDVVQAGGGNDIIAVTTIHSRYFGQSGNDSFFSEGWQNLFSGGAGNDTISYQPRDDSSVVGGSGVTISLFEGLAQTGSSRTETLLSIENAIGSNASDTVVGANGGNVLDGRSGNDDIYGLGGRDVLTGNFGADRLTGGDGADRFDYNNRLESTVGIDRDLIVDFSAGEGDRIDLSTIDAKANAAGNQAFSFIGTSEFSGRAGQLRYDGATVTGDVNGDGSADFQIEVNVSSMSASDFIL